jgi:hypothetical protein
METKKESITSSQLVYETTNSQSGNFYVCILNNTNTVLSVKYTSTVHAISGKYSNTFNVTLAPNEKKFIGNTCNFDVAGTSHCGSNITYAIN